MKTLSIFNTLMVICGFALITGCQNRETSEEISLESNIVDEKDMGKLPWVLDIEKTTVDNEHYRIAKWSGKHLQMVLMSIKPGEEIDLEKHDNHDQFIRIEQGQARVIMGITEDDLTYDKNISDDWAVFIPAGYYHNIKNTGDTDLKVYTIYGPAEHPSGTINETYLDAVEYHHKEHE